MSAAENILHVQLDAPLPADVAVGAGTAVFVAGTCFSARAPIRELRLTVDGEEQPVLAHSMPRHDFVCSLHPAIDPFLAAEDPRCLEDPRVLAYRSGFWGLARIGRPGAELGLRAEIADQILPMTCARGPPKMLRRTPELALRGTRLRLLTRPPRIPAQGR